MIDSLNLDQLRVFVTIADQGSFSAAARHLHRAQSAVSNAVANLENVLGVALFDRQGWKPALTAHGRSLLVDAKAVLARADQLKMRAKGLTQGVEAEMSIVFDVMFPTARFVELVTRFQDAFPGVVLRLCVDALGGVPERVLTGGYDLGVQGSLPDISPELISHSLPDIAVVPVVAPGHPLAGHQAIRNSALRDHTQIVLTDDSKRTEGRTFFVFSDKRILTTDLGSKRAILLAKLGWGFMPRSFVEDDLSSGRLVVLDLVNRPLPTRSMQLFAVHRCNEPLGPAAQWMLEALLSCGTATTGDRAGPQQ